MGYNVELSNIPERTVKPRKAGVTMVMDKGLSLRGTEDFLDSAGESPLSITIVTPALRGFTVRSGMFDNSTL